MDDVDDDDACLNLIFHSKFHEIASKILLKLKSIYPIAQVLIIH